jgi:hypothetical protein
MQTSAAHVLTPPQFLAMAANLLLQFVVNAPRTEGKRLFRSIEAGKPVKLVRVKMDDGSELMMEVVLDKREYRGALNFRLFRQHVHSLCIRAAALLSDEEKKASLPLFSDKNSGDSLFLAPGVVVQDGVVNLLVVGAKRPGTGSLTMQLVFLDPDQFQTTPQAQSQSQSTP